MNQRSTLFSVIGVVVGDSSHCGAVLFRGAQCVSPIIHHLRFKKAEHSFAIIFAVA